MSILLAAMFALGFVALAEQHRNMPRSHPPADLVKPLPGVPLSAEQVEEREPSLVPGTAVETARYAVYRDSAGRLRIETVSREPGKASLYLLDPTTGSRVVCLMSEKIAYRIMGPKLGEDGFALGFGGVGEGLPPAAWTTTTEKLGHRTIDDNEFEGTRIVQTVADQPELMNKREIWDSGELKITGLALTSGSFGRTTARLRNLHRGEPDAGLFAIPSGYRIVDIKMSDKGR